MKNLNGRYENIDSISAGNLGKIYINKMFEDKISKEGSNTIIQQEGRRTMGWKIDDGRPIWTQLKEQMIKRIVSGTYPSGEKLPSVRDLAGEAGVNPNTMQRALSALDQDGLTITNRTSGRCVTEDVTKIEECRKDIAHKIVKQYIRDLEELGYNKEDAVALIGKEEEE